MAENMSAAPTASITLKAVSEFFLNDANGNRAYGTLSGFGAEWKLLSDEAKAEIKAGLSDGSFTY